MEDQNKLIVFAIACFAFALGPFILMYMWRPDRLEKLNKKSDSK